MSDDWSSKERAGRVHRSSADIETADIEGTLSPSEAFGIIADKRKRAVLYLLEGQEETVRVEIIADHITAWETDIPVEQTGRESRRNVLAGLHHAQLPKLADRGLLNYDSEDGVVTVTERMDAIQPYVDFAKRTENDDVEALIEQNAST